MSKLEKNAQNEVMIEASKYGRFFRANVGMGWTSNIKPIRIMKAGKFDVQAGDMILKSARPLDTGLPKGFPDLVGLARVTVTPDMVGQVIGVFTGLEVKSDTGRASDEQNKIGKVIIDNGGRWGVVRSAQDTEKICK